MLPNPGFDYLGQFRSMRIPIVAFLIFLLSVAIQAQDSRSLEIGLYNDNWGGGFTSIYDDLRTYHLQVDYEKRQKLRIYGRVSFLTNRFDTDSSHQRSLDEWSAGVAVPVFKFKQGETGIFWLRSGLLARTSIVGRSIQNAVHDLLDIDEPNLPYYDTDGVHPSIGYQLELNLLDMPLSNNSSMTVRLSHTLDYTHNYSTIASINARMTRGRPGHEIEFSPGYVFADNQLENNQLLRNVLDAESGPRLGIRVNRNRIFYDFQIFPEGGFSYGGIGINLLRGKNSEGNIDPGVGIRGSVLGNSYGYSVQYSFLSKNAFNRNMSLIVNHGYHTILKKSLPVSPVVSAHASQITFGAEMQLLPKRESPRKIEPFVNLSAGHKFISLYSGVMPDEETISHHFILNTDQGVEVNLPLNFISKSWVPTFSIFHRLMVLGSLTPDKESGLVNPDNSPYRTYQSAVGVGMRL